MPATDTPFVNPPKQEVTMSKANRPLALMLAALTLALGSGSFVSASHAAIPEHASSQLEQAHSRR
jgi:hypothetical protein